MIKIGVVFRRWPRGIAAAELWFDLDRMKFRILYKEWTKRALQEWIPEQCTKAWMNHFVRKQSTLDPRSYFIHHVKQAWIPVIKEIVDQL